MSLHSKTQIVRNSTQPLLDAFLALQDSSLMPHQASANLLILSAKQLTPTAIVTHVIPDTSSKECCVSWVKLPPLTSIVLHSKMVFAPNALQVSTYHRMEVANNSILYARVSTTLQEDALPATLATFWSVILALWELVRLVVVIPIAKLQTAAKDVHNATADTSFLLKPPASN